MAEEQEIMETTEAAQVDSVDSSLPIEGQQPETTPEPVADTTPQQEQQTPQSAPAPDGSNPTWWKPDLFQLKYRGAAVSPKDYSHAVALMQKGYSYENAMSEVKREKAEVDALKSKYIEYEKLEEAFKTNPAFKAQILRLKQESEGARAVQQSYANPQLEQVTQKLGEFEKFMGTWREQQADNAVQSEIESLRAKFPDAPFDAVTESGKTLMWDILNHAHTNRLPSLMTAYRDYMFDNVVTNAKMQGAQQAAQQRQANTRKGIVSTGTPKPASPVPPQNVRGMSYDQIAEQIKKEHGLTS